MTSPDPIAPKIELAVDALLRAIIATEKLQPSSIGRSLIAINVEEGAATAADLDDIIISPISMACRSEIAALGSLLFNTVGKLDPVADVVWRIAGMDAGNGDRRPAILDDVWRQVGSEGDANWR